MGEPVAFFNFKGKTTRWNFDDFIFSRLAKFSTIKIPFLAKIWWTENLESVPKSILGESIPTKLIFLDARYFAAETDKPGFLVK